MSGCDWAANGSGYGAHPGDVDNLDLFNRTNNTIKYASVDYRGLRFGGSYSFGGVAGSMSQRQIWSLGAAYSDGPFHSAVGYLVANQPNFSFFGNTATASATGANLAGPVLAGYATANSQRIAAGAVSYDIKALTLGAVYSNVQFRSLGSVAIGGLGSGPARYTGNATFNIGELNAKYMLTPTVQLATALSYTRTSTSSIRQGAYYRQVNIGAKYLLSKVTDLYLVGVYESASGVDSTGKSAVAAITGATASSTSKQVVVTAGLRRAF